MYRCESWTIKNAEHHIIDAFELWCWRRLLRVSWIARRSNQSIVKIIIPKYSLEGLMLKFEVPIIWPLDVKNWLFGKDLDAGKDWRRRKGNDRRWDVWMTSPTQWIWVWASAGRWWRTGKSGVLKFHGVTESDMTEWLDWTELNWYPRYSSFPLKGIVNIINWSVTVGQQITLINYQRVLCHPYFIYLRTNTHGLNSWINDSWSFIPWVY